MPRIRIGKQTELSATPHSLVKTDGANEQMYLAPGVNGDVLTIVTGVPTWNAVPYPSEFDQQVLAHAGQGMGDRFLSFLKIQTGARSLTPQDGDDPDAILSRAEAAVAQGDAQKALDEVAALPPEAQAELADWQALAKDHIAFQTALATLSQAASP